MTIGHGSPDFRAIPGLSYLEDGQFQHNPPAALIDLEHLKCRTGIAVCWTRLNLWANRLIAWKRPADAQRAVISAASD